jgi:hypothetical protein
LLQNQAIPVSASSPRHCARSAQNFANKKTSFSSLLAETGSFSTSGLPNEPLKQTVAIVLPNLIHQSKARDLKR